MSATAPDLSPPQVAAGSTATDTQMLTALVRECAVSGIGRSALLLRMSDLPSALRRPHHVRLARAAIEPLTHADRARVYALSAGDFALVWRGDAGPALALATAALARLFEGEQIAGISAPWQVFHLPGHAEAMMSAMRPRSAPQAASARPPPAKLDIRALAVLEHGLATVDVARFVRRRRICSLGTDGTFHLEWERRVLSVRELAETLAPDCAVQADPWLFRRLTRTLDQRMLSLLAAPMELRGVGAFSVGLNVASLLSPSFLRFDGALPAALRGHVILELSPPDVLGDLAAFLFARDFARERGYRLLLGDLETELLPILTLERMGLDLMQVRWSKALPPLMGENGLAVLRDPSRCVLIHADTAEAVAWGRAMGIGLYQGRAVEPA